MSEESKKIDKVVYIVDSHIAINDRVSKLVGLRDAFKKLVLIKAGRQSIQNQMIGVSPLINPIAILQKLGLSRFNNILDKYVFFPSSKIFYVRAVTRRLSKLIKNDLSNKDQVSVLVCLPAHDLLLVGLKLKQKYPKIKWLIDWQDLWSYDEYYLERIPKYFRRRMLELEAKSFTGCDMNITTNAYAKKIVEEVYHVKPERVMFINHHYDIQDYKQNQQSLIGSGNSELKDVIKIGFLGSLFKPPRVPGKRVVEAIQYNREKDEKLELHLYGDSEKTLNKYLSEYKNKGIYAHGRYNHIESIKKIAECDYLLLVLSDLSNCNIVMSIKLPHYLLLGKPIIAIVPENSIVADIIQKTGGGYVISSAMEDWGKELNHLLCKIKTNKLILKRNMREIEKYSWENISRHWLDVLKTV